MPILKKVDRADGQRGWLGRPWGVGRQLSNLASDFDPRSYGFAKLSDLVRKTGAFEIDQSEGRSMRIRVKPGQKSSNPQEQELNERKPPRLSKRGEHPAIDEDHLPVEESDAERRQEHGGADQLLGPAPAPAGVRRRPTD